MCSNQVVQRKTVYGVGTNDADYPVYIYETKDGKTRAVWRCPYYRSWVHMLERCYSAKWWAKHPSYVGCETSPEWYLFSTFRAWMETQDWEGKQLDKDILIPGNKVYSPDVCIFINQGLNKFLTNSVKARGPWPLGVSTWGGRFQAQCGNPFSGEHEHLGFFVAPEEAHEAWRQRKHELACQYADMQTDPRIAEALRTRFAVATFPASNEPEEVCNA